MHMHDAVCTHSTTVCCKVTLQEAVKFWSVESWIKFRSRYSSIINLQLWKCTLTLVEDAVVGSLLQSHLILIIMVTQPAINDIIPIKTYGTNNCNCRKPSEVKHKLLTKLSVLQGWHPAKTHMWNPKINTSTLNYVTELRLHGETVHYTIYTVHCTNVQPQQLTPTISSEASPRKGNVTWPYPCAVVGVLPGGRRSYWSEV